MRVLAFLAVSLVALVAPPAQGHGLVNAGELETLLVQDEASDVITGLDYGFDLVQLYVGEAHVPGVGDGIYVHTILYGGAGADRPGLDGPQEVSFEFDFGGKVVQREISTSDGTTFEGDFDQLTVVPGDGEVEVQRAFLLYPAGVGPGSALTSLRATSHVNGERRDVAPGGYFLPGDAAEVPSEDSGQVIDSYLLRGPTGYLSQVEVIAMADGPEFLVTAWTGLKAGSQHIMLSPEAFHDGWSASVEGAGGATTPGGNQIFTVRLQPGSGPFRIDLYTDIGGHVELTAEQTSEGLHLASPESAAVQPADKVQESPAPAWLALAALGAVLLVRKAQR